MENLATQAVVAALAGNWEEAIKINKKILKTTPNDLNALNRLAYAYQVTNELVKSKTTYQKVVKLDKYNIIATKNLERLSQWKGKKRQPANLNKISTNSDIFLEEPGKTKLVTLINLAPLSTISVLRPSQPVKLCVKRKSILATDESNKYIGALPDDLAFKLMRFLKNNYKYTCFIKSSAKGNVVVFVREVQRGKRLKNQPSFPAGTSELDYLIIPPIDVTVQDKPTEKPLVTSDEDLGEEKPLESDEEEKEEEEN